VSHKAILLPGIVLPAQLAYPALLEALGEGVDARAKELEVYADFGPLGRTEMKVASRNSARLRRLNAAKRSLSSSQIRDAVDFGDVADRHASLDALRHHGTRAFRELVAGELVLLTGGGHRSVSRVPCAQRALTGNVRIFGSPELPLVGPGVWAVWVPCMAERRAGRRRAGTRPSGRARQRARRA
jgi:hypothetical protein